MPPRTMPDEAHRLHRHICNALVEARAGILAGAITGHHDNHARLAFNGPAIGNAPADFALTFYRRGHRVEVWPAVPAHPNGHIGSLKSWRCIANEEESAAAHCRMSYDPARPAEQVARAIVRQVALPYLAHWRDIVAAMAEQIDTRQEARELAAEIARRAGLHDEKAHTGGEFPREIYLNAHGAHGTVKVYDYGSTEIRLTVRGEPSLAKAIADAIGAWQESKRHPVLARQHHPKAVGAGELPLFSPRQVEA